MNGLSKDGGHTRTGAVGILKGKKLSHLAPTATHVKGLLKDLFSYLRTSKNSILLRNCVLHYELEFIHPFSDGNGRMGRLWQTLLLSRLHPVFAFTPVESLIQSRQREYYRV